MKPSLKQIPENYRYIAILGKALNEQATLANGFAPMGPESIKLRLEEEYDALNQEAAELKKYISYREQAPNPPKGFAAQLASFIRNFKGQQELSPLEQSTIDELKEGLASIETQAHMVQVYLAQ